MLPKGHLEFTHKSQPTVLSGHQTIEQVGVCVEMTSPGEKPSLEESGWLCSGAPGDHLLNVLLWVLREARDLSLGSLVAKSLDLAKEVGGGCRTQPRTVVLNRALSSFSVLKSRIR